MKRIAAAIVVLVLLTCAGFSAPLEIAFHLAIGWAVFLWRTLPEVHVNGSGVATALVCLVGFLFGVHQLGRWLAGNWGNVGDWKLQHSASVAALVVVAFVAGISFVGIAHHLTWLARTDRPLFSAGGRAAARRAQSSNNLKQIGISSRTFEDSIGAIPRPGAFVDESHALHSWQTLISAFSENVATYKSIDLSRPWTHASNRTAFSTTVPGYLHPGIGGHDSVDGYAASHYAGNVHVLGGSERTRFADIGDGASNTVLAGEVRECFRAWGDPWNLRDPALGVNQSPDGFGGPIANGANMLMADGSVGFLSDEADPAVLRALATPNGGETNERP